LPVGHHHNQNHDPHTTAASIEDVLAEFGTQTTDTQVLKENVPTSSSIDLIFSTAATTGSTDDIINKYDLQHIGITHHIMTHLV
jgi:hypothetical protein